MIMAKLLLLILITDKIMLKILIFQAKIKALTIFLEMLIKAIKYSKIVHNKTKIYQINHGKYHQT